MVCNFIVKALDVYISTLCALWYSNNVFNQDTQATSAFINKFFGASSVCTLFLTFFLGFLPDRNNYRRLVLPIFFGVFMLVWWCMWESAWLVTGWLLYWESAQLSLWAPTPQSRGCWLETSVHRLREQHSGCTIWVEHWSSIVRNRRCSDGRFFGRKGIFLCSSLMGRRTEILPIAL